jgi:hypothetical protein
MRNRAAKLILIALAGVAFPILTTWLPVHVVNTWTGHERQIIVNWTVFDGAGNILARSAEQTLLPGQAADFDYGTGVYDAPRAAIRVVLRVEGAGRNRNAGTPGPDDFIATQEIFNIGDGRTTVFLPCIEQ